MDQVELEQAVLYIREQLDILMDLVEDLHSVYFEEDDDPSENVPEEQETRLPVMSIV